jgi:predicted GNAT family acetyltransferase
LKLLIFDRAETFLKRVEHFLEKNEAANNLMLGLLYSLREQEKSGVTVSELMAVVEDEHGALVLIILLNRINLIISGDGAPAEAAIEEIICLLENTGRIVPGIVGPTEAVRPLAELWGRTKSLTPILKMNQRIYRLDQVNPLQLAPGELILAEEWHTDVVSDWIYKFAADIGDPMSREEASLKARDNIDASLLYLWQDHEVVSMAKKSRPTKNGVVVTLVYTPPYFRNKGYASACVASLCKLLLGEGYSFCSLYTDLSNPTSNDIYTKIGYRPVQDSVMYRFSQRF